MKIRQLVYLCEQHMQHVFAFIMLQMGQPSASPVLVDTWSALADRHGYWQRDFPLVSHKPSCSSHALAEGECR